MAMQRRQFLADVRRYSGAAAALPLLGPLVATAAGGSNLRLGKFSFDVTPPMGHACCGGWIPAVSAVDDPLQAMGIVLVGADRPIVLCALDWTGLLNEAHWEWRTALAEAAGTTPERVAVHCVHQHDAPLACLGAEKLTASQENLPRPVDVGFFRRTLEQAREAVAAAVRSTEPVTHLGQAQATVDRVAGNRRVYRDAAGQVLAMRGSACRDANLQQLPEGTIDPWLKTVAFYHGTRKLAACSYYATHPMSHYGKGRVSSDFVGLARKQRQKDEPDTLQMYFTGCAGNVAAGKYNDGSPAMREVLMQRMLTAMRTADAALKPEPIDSITWRSVDVVPQALPSIRADELREQLAAKSGTIASRNRAAFMLSWLQRTERRLPFVLSALRVNQTSLLHLPAECFVEYQLRTQQAHPGQFVATAAYGDAGCWYIPTREEYPHGGYEVGASFCDASLDEALAKGIASLLA